MEDGQMTDTEGRGDKLDNQEEEEKTDRKKERGRK
jgi:hypothetical protein